MVKKKPPKKRRPKGKPLSQSLREREEQLAAEEEEAAAEGDELGEAAAGEADEGEAHDDLRSEPPPRADFDDDEQDRASGADDQPEQERAEDEERDEDEEDEDEEDEDEERAEDEERDEEDEEDEDEDLAAAQMGHQRYVIAGFFGLWLVAGYICGLMLEAAWSRFAAKDWFVESLPLLAAVPHEGELLSRASVSLVLGVLIGGAIVLRYYYKPEVRTWADEVAEQTTKVKWPTRKEVGNNTLVVIVASAIITLYLTLIDRLWGFVTNLIYSGA